MTIEEAIKVTKILVGDDTVQDDLIKVYLRVSGQKIINQAFPYKEVEYLDKKQNIGVPEKYHSIWCEIAAFLINKRGAEGQITHAENGITRVYESTNIPTSMLKDIVPYGEIL